MLIDGFMAGTLLTFPFQPATDLLGTLLLLKQHVDMTRQLHCHFNGFGFVCMALFGLPVRLHMAVTALPCVPCKFSANGGLRTVHIPRYPILQIPLFQAHFDIIPLRKGKLCISHKVSRQ
ncbi:hypothetical protein SAMN05421863_100518 [Nitrosomonas communis]|uniref:Uncharacterized protein n=2 Tax=Nitrosomonas communis TaxID=44574 RepID=A0A1I4KUT0_9PROT|nr:hypothetical protein SAMN05421863_100518 [Nitrosomonas communis]